MSDGLKLSAWFDGKWLITILVMTVIQGSITWTQFAALKEVVAKLEARIDHMARQLQTVNGDYIKMNADLSTVRQQTSDHESRLRALELKR